MFITDNENNELVITKFGQLVSDARHDNVLVRFEYNNSPNDVFTTATGSGTVTNANSMCLATIGTGTGVAQVRSTHSNIYHPAHEVHAFFTAKFTKDGDEGSYQRIGLLDDNDGFGIGMEGDTFCVFKKDGGVQTNVIQADFSKNKLDGTKGSDEKGKEFTINLAALNIFKISYGWLGSAPCSFSVYGGQDRGWIAFHVIDEINVATEPTIASPSHHIHMECGRSASSGNTLSLSTGSWCAGSTGERTKAGHRRFSKSFTKTIAANSAGYIGTLSNIATYQSKTNKMPINLLYVGASTEGTKPVTVTIYKDATLVDTAPADIDADSSVMQVDIAGSATAGTLAIAFPMAKVATLTANVNSLGLELHPNEAYTFIGTSIANADVELTVRWEEIHA